MKSLDDAMINIWLKMHSDFVESSIITPLSTHVEALRAGDIVRFRELDYPSAHNASVETFKAIHQLAGFFSRYTFKGDVYTAEERKERSLDDFVQTQRQLSFAEIDQVGHRILKAMRVEMTRILGSCPPMEELYDSCEHGKRSAVGLNAQDALMFEKRFQTLSGTAAQKVAFRDVWRTDPVLRHCLKRSQLKRLLRNAGDATSLCAIAVPKKWKIDRIIVPNTVTGAFVTAGIGRVIEKRLKDFCSIDLSTQPDLHKVLACRASVTRHLITCDLSKASDLITREHIRRVMPQDWFTLLDNMRVPFIEVDGQIVRCQTFMTMGVGYTFPLQTLYFYVLLKVLAREFRIKGRISVFGDDLIYPYWLHEPVLWAFKHLNHRVNVDKTFSEHHFRESCGGDYYRGVDVRPVMPKGSHVDDDIDQQRFLYKVYNRLATKWSTDWDLPSVFDYILGLLKEDFGVVYQVPVLQSEDSGIRVLSPTEKLYGVEMSPVRFIDCTGTGNGMYYYHRIAAGKKYKQVDAVWPYYWRTLMSSTLDERRLFDPEEDWGGQRISESPSALVYRKPSDRSKRQYKYIIAHGKRRKVCRTMAHVAIVGGSYHKLERSPLW